MKTKESNCLTRTIMLNLIRYFNLKIMILEIDFHSKIKRKKL